MSRQRLDSVALAVLFGLFYFIQGITEPTEGLIAQPVRSLLKSWGENVESVARFSALLALPWALKPFYGLVSDFVPLGGYYRKSYLIAASAIASTCLAILYASELSQGAVGRLFLLLVVPTVCVAFGDVVVDALMVEKGQPLGLTGRFQSVQWGALYGATIITGTLGGYLSAHSRQQIGFLICAIATLLTLVLSLVAVRERPVRPSRAAARETWQALRQATRNRTLWAAAAFLFLWSFNPFSHAVLYMYQTDVLGLSEEFYGNTLSWGAVAAMLGSFAYGFYCRRVSMRLLVHLSIVLGIASSLAYWALHGEKSALAIRLAFDFSLATAVVIQLDMAARVCPPRAAGTIFAFLLAVANLAESLAIWFGGWFYQALLPGGNPRAFNILVGIAAACTATCWLVVPWLHGPEQPQE